MDKRECDNASENQNLMGILLWQEQTKNGKHPSTIYYGKSKKMENKNLIRE